MAFISRKIAKLFWLCGGWTVTILFFIGLVVRLTVKDHFSGVCAVYYATPPLVLSISAFAAGVFWFRRAKKAVGAGLLLAAVACIIWNHQACYVRNSTEDEPTAYEQDSTEKNAAMARDPALPSIRLLYWNPWHGKLGWAAVIDTITAHDPDVIALVEAGDASHEDRRRYEDAFPDYEMSNGSERVLILCRGKVANLHQCSLPSYSLYQTADIEVRGQSFKLVVVDLGSAPMLSRKGRMKKLAEETDKTKAAPMVMAGDFNLPHDSVHFRLFDDRLQNAFREAGNGYAPTWPMLMPLIQIDHVWTNRHVRVDRCITGWTRCSDHRPIVVDFECVPGNGNQANPAELQ